jgi:hypothetical protein
VDAGDAADAALTANDTWYLPSGADADLRAGDAGCTLLQIKRS